MFSVYVALFGVLQDILKRENVFHYNSGAEEKGWPKGQDLIYDNEYDNIFLIQTCFAHTRHT